MKKFLKKLVWTILPLILLLSFPIILLLKSGEGTTVDEAILIQEDKNSLIGYAYSNVSTTLKINKTKQCEPNLLILGTSRVMQFRDFFFKNSNSVYNAGGGVAKIKEFQFFFNEVYKEGRKPSVLIIALDQYFFNKNWDNLKSNSYPLPDTSVEIISNSEVLRQTLNSILSQKIGVDEFLSIINTKNDNVGLTAKVYNEGFRKDGSYYYKRIIQDNEKGNSTLFQEVFDRIDNGNMRFEHGDIINPEALKELDKFLLYCKDSDIHVVAFLPPFAHCVLDKMNQTGKYEYINELSSNISPLIEKYNYSYFDFTDIESCGSSDEEAIDGFHGSEKTYLRILKEMVKKDSILAELALNGADLEEIIINSKSNFEITQ